MLFQLSGILNSREFFKGTLELSYFNGLNSVYENLSLKGPTSKKSQSVLITKIQFKKHIRGCHSKSPKSREPRRIIIARPLTPQRV